MYSSCNKGIVFNAMTDHVDYKDPSLFYLSPEKVIDKATFKNPHQYSEGIEFVLVNGELVVFEGNHTKKTPGKVLRRS